MEFLMEVGKVSKMIFLQKVKKSTFYNLFSFQFKKLQ